MLREVCKLSDSKSLGLSHLNCRLLNLCLWNSIPEMTDLFNLCVNRGIFPTTWKEGTVVPIPKGNKVKTLENIQPNSLLPTPGKVLEHFIHRRIYLYLMEHNLLSTKQTGFRKYYGIHDAIIDLVNFIHNRFN